MDKVYDFLTKELQLNNQTVVVGVSGGPDSMVLLSLLLSLREELNLNIVCAHINHGLRKESETEKLFVKHYCQQKGIPFEYLKINNYNDENFHHQARLKRYQFFETLIEKYQAQYLFTAHHGDDLMETVLMRLVRGSTLKGYSGFNKITKMNNYTMVRPLIFITKNQIQDYAKEYNIEYCKDLSNFKEIYTRNRFRKHMLPFLKKENTQVNDKFLKFSELLDEYHQYIKKVVLAEFPKVYQNKKLNLAKFKDLENIIQKEVINYLLETIYDKNITLVSDVHCELILDMIYSNKPNQTVYLPHQLQAIKSYNELIIAETGNYEDYQLELKAVNLLPNGKTIEILKESDSDDNYICRLNYKDLKPPILIRNKQPGDKIKIKGLIGSKKIKDIFIDEKIPLQARKTWPIVVDANNQLLWLPGLKKSEINQPKNKKCDIILKYY